MLAKIKNVSVDINYLNKYPNHILVYSDTMDLDKFNIDELTQLDNSYKFEIAKLTSPAFVVHHKRKDFVKLFTEELKKLKSAIHAFKNHIFIIPILLGKDTDHFRKIIDPYMKKHLGSCENVWFLW